MRRTSSGGGERIAARVRARCACSGPADSQPMASDTSTPSMHFESTSVAGRTRVRQRTRVWRRTRAACASSVLCTRGLVCKAQSREKARKQRSGDPGAHPLSRFRWCTIAQRRQEMHHRSNRRSLKSRSLRGEAASMDRRKLCTGRRLHWRSPSSLVAMHRVLFLTQKSSPMPLNGIGELNCAALLQERQRSRAALPHRWSDEGGQGAQRPRQPCQVQQRSARQPGRYKLKERSAPSNSTGWNSVFAPARRGGFASRYRCGARRAGAERVVDKLWLCGVAKGSVQIPVERAPIELSFAATWRVCCVSAAVEHVKDLSPDVGS